GWRGRSAAEPVVRPLARTWADGVRVKSRGFPSAVLGKVADYEPRLRAPVAGHAGDTRHSARPTPRLQWHEALSALRPQDLAPQEERRDRRERGLSDSAPRD